MKYAQQLSFVVKMNGIASFIQYIVLYFIFKIIYGICLDGENMCGVLIAWLLICIIGDQVTKRVWVHISLTSLSNHMFVHGKSEDLDFHLNTSFYLLCLFN